MMGDTYLLSFSLAASRHLYSTYSLFNSLSDAGISKVLCMPIGGRYHVMVAFICLYRGSIMIR